MPSLKNQGYLVFGSLTILAGKSRAQLAPTGIYCDLAFMLSGELNDPTQPTCTLVFLSSTSRVIMRYFSRKMQIKVGNNMGNHFF